MKPSALSAKLRNEKERKEQREGQAGPGRCPIHSNFKKIELTCMACPAAHLASTSPSASAAPNPAATQAIVTPATSRKAPLVSE